MAFESLTDKLQNVFKKLRSKGRLTEEDVKLALKEVKMALLEADVNFRVVKQFTKSVQEQAIGQDVMNGLNPGQMVIKIVNDELVKLMGSETTELPMHPGNEITVYMMAGLQGAGKTTTVAKLAGKLKSKGKKPLLVACDVYRPAAITQLQVNGEKQGVEVFSMGDKQKPVDIAKAAIEHAKSHQQNVVLIDTAGRLHIDEDMMQELADIKENIHVDATVLVVDAMTGQDAVNVAKTFADKVGIDGVILTKMDGDTRGGAALSIKAKDGLIGNSKTNSHCQRKKNHQINRHCHIMTHSVILFRPEHLSHNNGKPAAQTIQPAGYKKHQRACTSNSSQCIYTNKFTGNNGVCNIIKLLKKITQTHGNHKFNNKAYRISRCHIMNTVFHFLSCSFLFLLFSVP